MPFRKKRNYQRKKQNKIVRYKKPLQLGFPSKMRTKMRYCGLVSIDPPAATAGYYIFRANSIYDPNYTLSSGTTSDHQPYTHDTWATLYDHYIVLGSIMKATITSAASGTGEGVVAGVLLDDSATFVVTDIELLMEKHYTKTALLTQSNSNKPLTLTKKFSAKRWFGVKDVVDNKSSYGANFGYNPSDSAYYGIFVGSLDDTYTDNPPKFNIAVTIDYIVELSEPKELVQS